MTSAVFVCRVCSHFSPYMQTVKYTASLDIIPQASLKFRANRKEIKHSRNRRETWKKNQWSASCVLLQKKAGREVGWLSTIFYPQNTATLPSPLRLKMSVCKFQETVTAFENVRRSRHFLLSPRVIPTKLQTIAITAVSIRFNFLTMWSGKRRYEGQQTPATQRSKPVS